MRNSSYIRLIARVNAFKLKESMLCRAICDSSFTYLSTFISNINVGFTAHSLRLLYFRLRNVSTQKPWYGCIVFYIREKSETESILLINRHLKKQPQCHKSFGHSSTDINRNILITGYALIIKNIIIALRRLFSPASGKSKKFTFLHFISSH